jgi:hypothetical protein
VKEKKIKRRERLEQHDEEFQLRKQQGLSPLAALVNSSSDEEEESDGEWATSDRWEPAPPSPRAEGTTAEPPVVGLSEEVPAGAT